MLAAAVDKMKTSQGNVPVIVVGGGAVLCGDSLEGASSLIRPPFASVANAVGAAIPQVSGVVDGVYALGSGGEQRGSVLESLEAEAMQRAVQAGADPEKCQTVTKEEIPLAYLPGGVTRVYIRVVGDLAEPEPAHANSGGTFHPGQTLPQGQEPEQELGSEQEIGERESTAAEQPQQQQQQKEQALLKDTEQNQGSADSPIKPPSMQRQQAHASSPGTADSETARQQDQQLGEPQVDADGTWIISKADVDALAIGCGILGTGGGGSSHINRLKVLRELDR